MKAANALEVEVVVASERPSTLEATHPRDLLTLDFRDPDAAARKAAAFHQSTPFQAVVPVDDDTAVVAAAIAEAVGLPHNSRASAEAARNKLRMREILSEAGVPVPGFRVFPLQQDPPSRIWNEIAYPCVAKPLFLSASRGVIRAENAAELRAALRRIAALLSDPDLAARGGPLSRSALVEDFIPGREFALEGLLTRGELRVLALFDKPDPLDGPYFEETLYVTPSRLPGEVQAEISATAANAARALGLREGPVHAELRVNDEGIWLIEMAARSIGGLCSRTLRFGAGISLEELILRRALGRDVTALERHPRPAGVMMIPIPGAGILEEVRGKEEAARVPGIEEVAITAHPGRKLIPLPEASSYLGFLFARAETPEEVEQALRQAHRKLEFVGRPD
jgi:biotin carboxylase